jgi:two-component system, chemotaxis family, sensor histidine kinase and response regulator PixL
MLKTVLVVDDDPKFLVALTTLLERAGYAIIPAKDGREAESKLTDGHSIDAAIVDLELPEIGGFQVISKLCKVGERVIPVVAVTGAYSDLYLEVAEYLGAQISIRKPPAGHSLNRLVEALQSVLSA